MFHWICPECGQEIPPARKECPSCEPGLVVAEAPPVEQAVVLRPEVVNAPVHRSAAIGDRGSRTTSTAVLDVEPVPQAPPPVPAELEILNLALAAQSELQEAAPEKLAAAPPPLPEAAVAPEAAAPDEPALPPVPPENTDDSTPGVARLLALVGRLQWEQNIASKNPPAGTMAPEPELPRLEVALNMSPPVQRNPQPVHAKLSRLDLPGITAYPFESVVSLSKGILSAESLSIRSVFPSSPAGNPASHNLARIAPRVPDGGSLVPRPAAPAWTSPGVEPLDSKAMKVAGPSARQIPVFAPHLAGLQKNTTAVLKSLRPHGQPAQLLQSAALPRVTLPGPALSSQLNSLAAAGLSVVPGFRPRVIRTGMPGWLVSLFVMVILLIAVVGAGTLFLPDSAASSAANAKESTVTSPGAAFPAQVASSPLARLIEVTGYRLVVDFNGKSEIHYLVVNHSGAQLGGVTVYVTLRHANAKPGQAPFTRFSFRAPDLGPYESREMISPIEKITRTANLPEWHDLRSDIEVGE